MHAEHRRRARRRAGGIYVAAPGALLLGSLWLASQVAVCWSPRVTPWELGLCDWAFVLPDLAMMAAVGVAGMLLTTLWHLGGETSQGQGHGRGMHHHLRRTCAGYDALADVRVHVKAAAALLTLTGCLFACGSLYAFFYVDAGALLLGAVLAAVALFFGTRVLVRS